MITRSSNVVVHTGAGISTAAGMSMVKCAYQGLCAQSVRDFGDKAMCLNPTFTLL